jgi:outer membrane receptor protein involved in Fe transport
MPALAQEAQETDPAGQEAEMRQDTVLITARKREENPIDVPISTAVLDASTANDLVVNSVFDYLQQIPGALLVSGGPPHLADVSIRGQGGGRVGFSESATGIYRNGVFIAGGGYGGRAHTRLDFFDNERVEVYRGPQGALYGRNAIGGAINVISARPQLNETSGFAKAGYDNVKTSKVETVVNLPILEDRAAIRAGLYWEDQKDGDITQVSTGKALDTEQRIGGRVSLRFDPDAATVLNFILEHRDDTTPGFSNLGFRPSLDPGPYQRNLEDVGVVEVQETQAFVDLEREFDGADLVVVGNYRTRDASRAGEDLDHFQGWSSGNATSAFRALAAEQEDFVRYGVEARLVSTNTQGLRWLIGVDAQSSKDDVSTQNTVPVAVGLVNRNTGQPLAPATTLANALRSDQNFVEELTSWSLFGSAEKALAERITGSVELRVQIDQKDFRFNNVAAGTGFDLSDEWTAVLPVATLSYALSENHNLFGRLSSGFRAGGFNAAGASPGFEELLTYDPERVYSGELGWKGRNGPMQYSMVGFYTYTDDVQILTAEDITGSGRLSFILQNGGATRIWGLEAEASGRFEVGPGNLILRGGIASTDGEFVDTELRLTGGIVDLSGQRVNRTRDYSATVSAVYSQPISARLSGFVSGSLQAEGGGSLNADGTSKNSDWELFDARIGIRNDRFSASVFAKNIGDREFVIQRISGNDFYNEKRRIGAELRVNF